MQMEQTLAPGRKRPPKPLDGSACVVADAACDPAGLTTEENAPVAVDCEAGLDCELTATSDRTD